MVRKRTTNEFDENQGFVQTRDRQARMAEKLKGRVAVEMITSDTPTV